MSNKAELRKSIREKRRSLSPEQQLAAANGLLTQLQTVRPFLQSEKIAMYLINDGEIDPVEVMYWCWQKGKQTYVPVVVQETMQNDGGKTKNSLLFAPVTDQTCYEENQYGIREPIVQHHEIITAEHLDLVLMPLVAFDENGNRVGMGGGFYDTTFEFKKTSLDRKPHLIGIAHEIQKVEGIAAEHWDIPLTTVITDKDVYTLHE